MDNFFNLKEYFNTRYPNKGASEKSFSKGDYIYKPPYDANYIYQVSDGVIKIGSYDNSGNRVIYDVLVPGDIFGNLGFLNREFNEFSKAVTRVELNVVNITMLKEALAEDGSFGLWFQEYVVGRWCKSEARLFSIASQDVTNRIVSLFYELKPHYEKFGINFESLLKHQDIANLVGATRQTVSKVIRKIKLEEIEFSPQS